MLKNFLYFQVFCLCCFYAESHAVTVEEVGPPLQKEAFEVIATMISKDYCSFLGLGYASQHANELSDAINNPAEYKNTLRLLQTEARGGNNFLCGENEFNHRHVVKYRAQLIESLKELRESDCAEPLRNKLSGLINAFNETIPPDVSADKKEELKLPEILYSVSNSGISLEDFIQKQERLSKPYPAQFSPPYPAQFLPPYPEERSGLGLAYGNLKYIFSGRRRGLL